MKILFVGDVIGRNGRRVLREHLSRVRNELDVDFTVVNVENAAGGFGVTVSVAEEILKLGVDAMTSGNHIWDKREVLEYFPREPRLVRPGNYPAGLPGPDCYIGVARNGVKVAVVNIQGRVFMPLTDCPFRYIEGRLEALRQEADVVLVDFHAEATSEKMAMGWFLDGKVAAVLGTHTHVPTADARVLPKGTAYVSDVGMTGPYESVIGMEVEGSLSRFLTGVNARFQPASEDLRFSAVVIEVDQESGKALSIRRCDQPSW